MSDRRKGFYFVGFFGKGCKAGCSFNSLNDKPFVIDRYEGRVIPKVMRLWKGNEVADEWYFFEDCTMKEVNEDVELRSEINSVWRGWCKKYKRKYSPILLKLDENKGGVV